MATDNKANAATDAATAKTVAPEAVAPQSTNAPDAAPTEAAPSTPDAAPTEAAPSTPNAAPTEAAPSAPDATEVYGTLFTRYVPEHYITGTYPDSKGKPRTYELIATQVTVGDKVHEVVFERDAWDEIAHSCSPSAEVIVAGVLRNTKKPYTVNEGKPNAYVRMRMRNARLHDIKETRGAALAFKRGARRPDFDELKARYGADAGVIDVDFTEEPKADLG